MTAKGTWKRVEREIAALFGTKRVPLSGINSGHGTHSDTLRPRLYIEVKYREKYAVFTLFRDIMSKAKAEDKTPILALKEKGKQGVLLMLRYEDILDVADEIKAARLNMEGKDGSRD